MSRNSLEREDLVKGFLLTRHWRDRHYSATTAGRGAVDLGFWAISNRGPLYLKVPQQQAICFVERNFQATADQAALLQGAVRKPLELTVMDGGAVDALYFQQQRQLNDARYQIPALCESDIKPTDRYLMERFVNAGFTAQGTLIERAGYVEIVNPKVTGNDYLPQLDAMSIDIETRAPTSEIYSIGASSSTGNIVFMLDKHTDPTPGTGDALLRKLELDHRNEEINYQLIYCASEKQLLERFFDWVQSRDPDALIGWNIVNFDLAVIHKRCNELNVTFALSRGGQQATVLQPSRNASGTTGQRVARIPGRAVLDGVDLLRAGFWSFESFALDNVASELLGTRKLITGDIDKIAEINRLFRDNKPALADYNLMDCILVQDIFKHADLLPFAQQRAAMTGLAIDRMGGSVAAFDHLYLPRLHRHGFVAKDTIGRESTGASPGGYVMDSVPGLYENVLVLDFKSLYPSIIRTFLIDPLGLTLASSKSESDTEDSKQTDFVEGFENARFSRDKHILPGLIEELWAKRDSAKQNNDRALSQAIKIIMNSFYGVLGSSGCRFHKQQLASSITRRGHEIITRSRDFIEAQGHSVIYGDTDSLFVLLGEGVDAGKAHSLGDGLMHALNSWWQETLKTEHRLESALEVEFETHYLKFLMPTVRGMATGSKKRYAGMIKNNDSQPGDKVETNNEEMKLVFKGLEAVRTDWTPLARNFQRELYRRIFLHEPFEDYVRQIATDLLNGALDDQLVYRKRLRRRLTDYQRNIPPHVQAARKQAKAGHWVNYIITRNGPEPTDALHSAPDYEHYLEKQLAPAADGILHFLDTSFRNINDAQMQMF